MCIYTCTLIQFSAVNVLPQKRHPKGLLSVGNSSRVFLYMHTYLILGFESFATKEAPLRHAVSSNMMTPATWVVTGKVGLGVASLVRSYMWGSSTSGRERVLGHGIQAIST